MKKSDTLKVFCGVDMAANKFDWHCEGIGGALENNQQGFAKLLNLLKSRHKLKNLHVVMESTGGYERALCKYLHSKEILLTIANPNRVRYYAKSEGILAKTDKIDARVLVDYAKSRKEPLQPTPQPLPEVEQLADLVDARAQLVESQKRHLQQARALKGRAMAAHNAVLNVLASEIASIEKDTREHLERHPDLAQKSAILSGIKGVGAVTVGVVLAHMPELGTISRNRASSLCGLAPFNDDSGKKIGQRYIRGGRGMIRRVLYMGAVSAVRHEPVLKVFYERLLAAGKAFKVAITAVMRKMIIHMNSKLKAWYAKQAVAQTSLASPT